MILELNSSNSGQTPQLLNSMELLTLWSLVQMKVEFWSTSFACCSGTTLGSRVVPCRRAGRDGVAVSRPQRGAPTQPNQGKKQTQGRARRHAAGPPRARPGDARASRRPMFSAESARAVRGSSGAGRRPTWWRRASLCHPPDRLGNRPGRAVCANMEGNMGAFD